MRPGQEVICIDDSPPKGGGSFFKNWIKEGQIYTIRKVESSLGSIKRVLLEELSNPLMFVPELGGKVEPGFSHKRFANLDGTPLLEEVEQGIEEMV